MSIFTCPRCLHLASVACACGAITWVIANPVRNDEAEEHLPNITVSAPVLTTTATTMTLSSTLVLHPGPAIVQNTVIDAEYSTRPVPRPLYEQHGEALAGPSIFAATREYYGITPPHQRSAVTKVSG
jgi:hypothetical protein